MSPAIGSRGCWHMIGIEFHSGRATISSTVSNTWGSSPGPGMLWALVPALIVNASMPPGAGTTSTLSQVVAATPGLSS